MCCAKIFGDQSIMNWRCEEVEIVHALSMKYFEVSRHFLFYRFQTNLRCKKDSKNRFENETQPPINHIYFSFREIPCSLIPKPLNKCILSVFGRFIEDYLTNLTCWEKSKNSAVLFSTRKSIMLLFRPT
jgi:hypothetical protein